jgi:FAD:protein FMN transferase
MEGRFGRLRDRRWLICAIALWSCDTRPAASEPLPAAAPVAVTEPASPKPTQPTPQPARKPLLSARRELMGTWFELKVVDRGDASAQARLERALDEIARLEGVLSEWQPDTEIARINDHAGKAALAVGPETFEVLRTGLEISRLSEGAFDLTWAAMRGLYRFEPDSAPSVPSAPAIKQRRALVDYRDLKLDSDKRTVRLARKGMAVGTGGIAKGYALDVVAAQLEAAGDTDYLLFAGGQVLVHGGREGRPWRIGIKHPRENERTIGYLELHEGSVSTSGDYEHSFIAPDGKRWHHILDLRTGYPATKSVSVTLIAPTGIAADALSTACFVLGPERCIAMLAQLPSKPQAVILDPELRVHVTEGIRDRVHMTDTSLLRAP